MMTHAALGVEKALVDASPLRFDKANKNQ